MCYGTELTSNAMLRWADECRVSWHYIQPGPFDRLRVRADPERLRRELQRSPQRRAAERPTYTSACSIRCRTPAPSSKNGAAITTPPARIRASAGSRRWPMRLACMHRVRNRTGRSRCLRAPRPVRLRPLSKQDSLTQGLWPRVDEPRGARHCLGLCNRFRYFGLKLFDKLATCAFVV